MIPAENIHPGMLITILGWSKQYEQQQVDTDDSPFPWSRPRCAENPLVGQPLMVEAISLPFFTARVMAGSTLIILDARDLRLHRVTGEYAQSCVNGYRDRKLVEDEREKKKYEQFRMLALGRAEMVPTEQPESCPVCGTETHLVMVGDIFNPSDMKQMQFCPKCRTGISK